MKAVIRPTAQDDILLRQFRWYRGAPREFRNPALSGLRVWPVKSDRNELIREMAEALDVEMTANDRPRRLTM